MEKGTPSPIQTLLESPQLQQAIDARAKILTEQETAQELWNNRTDFIPNYQQTSKAYLPEHESVDDLAHLTQEDEDFLNRQLGDGTDVIALREAHLQQKETPSMDMDMFFSDPKELTTRPYSVVLRELQASKESQNRTKSDDLFDELALKLAYDSSNGREQKTDDKKLTTLFDVADTGKLTAKETDDLFDRMVEFMPIKDVVNDDVQESTEGSEANTDVTTQVTPTAPLESQSDELTNAEMQEIVKSDLEKTRATLATLSVATRGKHTQKQNEKLQEKFHTALISYTRDYKTLTRLGIEELEADGVDAEDIHKAVVFGAAVEQESLAQAELAVLMAQNEKMGSFAKKWSSLSLTKKVLAGFTGTTVATGAVLATGGGALLLGLTNGVVAGLAGGMSFKAARTVDSLKHGTKRGFITSFGRRKLDDKKYALTELAATEARSAGDLSHVTAESLFDTIDMRAETDKRHNKKRMGMVIGALTVGSVAGLLIGSALNDDSENAKEVPIETTTTVAASTTTVPENTSPSTPATTEAAPPTTDNNNDGPTTTVPESDSSTGVGDEGDSGADEQPEASDEPEPEPITGDDENVQTDSETDPNEIETKTGSINVLDGDGFEDSLQNQFNLTDEQARDAYETIRPYITGQPGTYEVNGDIRIAEPGVFRFNEQAQTALEEYLRNLQHSSVESLPEVK
jgi:hypothetical protein